MCEKDEEAAHVWAKIYKDRQFKLKPPVLGMETTITHILPVVAFLKRLGNEALIDAGFPSNLAGLDVSFYDNNQPADGSPAKLIAVIRNALAHYPDYVAGERSQPNVSFDTPHVEFWTKSRNQKVVFETKGGWVHFMDVCHRVARKAAQQLLEAP